MGGVVGQNITYSTISQVTVSGSIIGNGIVGGVVGNNQFNSIISHTSATGSITGNDQVGGISGNNNRATIKESFSDATIIGNSSVGGIIGVDYWGVEISNNYSLSTISAQGSSYAGGIIGNCNETANILKNNYFAGTFDDESSNGNGIIAGRTIPDIDVGNFWDIDKSGVTTTKGNGTAKTTAEMKNINTFVAAGWEFAGLGLPNEIWDINENLNDGYPYLVWAQQYIEDMSVDIEVKTKINEVIAIYPNPFNDIVNITGNGINSVKVYTMSGVQMLDAKYNNESEITIQTSDFEKGIYLFVIDNNIYKLIKR